MKVKLLLTNRQRKSANNALKGQQPVRVIEHTKGVLTPKPLHSPLGQPENMDGCARVSTGPIPKSVKIKKTHQLFSNATPHGYSRKEWNQRLKEVLK